MEEITQSIVDDKMAFTEPDVQDDLMLFDKLVSDNGSSNPRDQFKSDLGVALGELIQDIKAIVDAGVQDYETVGGSPMTNQLGKDHVRAAKQKFNEVITLAEQAADANKKKIELQSTMRIKSR